MITSRAPNFNKEEQLIERSSNGLSTVEIKIYSQRIASMSIQGK